MKHAPLKHNQSHCPSATCLPRPNHKLMTKYTVLQPIYYVIGFSYFTGELAKYISSVQSSRSVVSDSLRPHEPQHARPPCPSPALHSFMDFILFIHLGNNAQSVGASLVAQRVKNLQCGRPRFSRWVGEDPLEKEKATHSSILAWRIPWTEEPGGLQSMGSQRAGQVEILLTPLSWYLLMSSASCQLITFMQEKTNLEAPQISQSLKN